MTDMTGLLADYGIDTDDVEVPDFEIDDGIYYFVIGDVFIQHGTKADPDGPDSVVISYRLTTDEDDDSDGKEKREYFNLPEDPENPDDDEKKKLGWYVKRLLDLGFERSEINNVGRDDLIGLTGTMQLVHVAGKGANKGKTFQNIRSLKVDEEVPAAPVAGTPVKTKAAPKKAAAPVEEEVPEEAPEEVTEAPKAKAPARASAAKVGAKKTAPRNPFA